MNPSIRELVVRLYSLPTPAIYRQLIADHYHARVHFDDLKVRLFSRSELETYGSASISALVSGQVQVVSSQETNNHHDVFLDVVYQMAQSTSTPSNRHAAETIATDTSASTVKMRLGVHIDVDAATGKIIKHWESWDGQMPPEDLWNLFKRRATGLLAVAHAQWKTRST